MAYLGFRVRLAHKIAAISAIGIAGLCAVGAIYWSGNASQERYRSVAAEARTIAKNTAKLDVDLLESRRSEKDFLLRSDEQYAAQHEARAKNVNTDLDALQALATGQADLAKNVAAAREGYGKYSEHFKAAVEAKRKLGLSEDKGLEGVLRKSVHDIESKIKEFDDPKLAVQMLMMRRHEKDFMLRRDKKYGDQLNQAATDFLTELASTSISDANKTEIKQKLTAYQQNFSAWMETALVVGAELKATSEAYAGIESTIGAMRSGAEKSLAESETANNNSRASTLQQMQIAVLVAFLAVVGLSIPLVRSITKPLGAMARAMGLLAEGDFAVALPGLERKDEIGEMARSVEAFKVKAVEKAQRESEEREAASATAAQLRKQEVCKLADQFETAVGDIVEKVSIASTDLEVAAGSLTQTSEATQRMSVTVASASEESSANVQSVASAAEEMASSVSEIGRQIAMSTKLTQAAVDQAQQTDQRINTLQGATTKIGDVVDLIAMIAEQTSLLALNATIEAARAGEAGRGFAVVASEVKALSAQTARATSEISAQISNIQSSTGESVIAIKEIGATIAHISEVTSAIAAAVEEQGAATNEIARNVQQAAEGTSQVASGISEVNRGAAETGTASSQVLVSAQSLSKEGGRLKSEVRKFLATVRAS